MQSALLYLSNRAHRARYRLETALTLAKGRRVIFLHIPKCAGSSVNLLFKSRMGSSRSGRVVLIDDRDERFCCRERLARAKEARFVGGHFGFETLEKIRGDAFVFTVLRDPFDRIRSVCGHLMTRGSPDPVLQSYAGLSLRDLLLTNDKPILQVTDNVLARMLAVSHDRRRVEKLSSEEIARKAIDNLKYLDHIGFFETLDDDLKYVARIAKMRFSSQWTNQTSAKAAVKSSADAIYPLNQLLRPIAETRVAADVAVFAEAKQKFCTPDRLSLKRFAEK